LPQANAVTDGMPTSRRSPGPAPRRTSGSACTAAVHGTERHDEHRAVAPPPAGGGVGRRPEYRSHQMDRVADWPVRGAGHARAL